MFIIYVYNSFICYWQALTRIVRSVEEIEAKIGENFKSLTAVSHRTQIVAGVKLRLYFIDQC